MADSALLNAIRATPLPEHTQSSGQGDPFLMAVAQGKEYPNASPIAMQNWSLTSPAFDPTTDLIGSGITKPFTLALSKMAGLKATPLLAGIFTGTKSGLFNAGKAIEAEEALAEGKSAEEVWQKYQVHKGIDKQFRYGEIDDSKMKLAQPFGNLNPLDARKDYLQLAQQNTSGKKTMALSNVINHPEFARAYPSIFNNTKVEFNPRMKAGTAAMYSDPVNQAYKLMLGRASSEKQMKKSIVHELQHAVQKYEGFIGGGMPAYREGSKEVFNKISNDLQNIMHNPTYLRGINELKSRGILKQKENLGQLMTRLPDNSPIRKEILANPAFKDFLKAYKARGLIDSTNHKAFMTYRNLPGEGEARNAAERLELTAEERAKYSPMTTHDLIRNTAVGDKTWDDLLNGPK